MPTSETGGFPGVLICKFATVFGTPNSDQGSGDILDLLWREQVSARLRWRVGGASAPILRHVTQGALVQH